MDVWSIFLLQGIFAGLMGGYCPHSNIHPTLALGGVAYQKHVPMSNLHASYMSNLNV